MLRGEDSTGLLQVARSDAFKVLKGPVDGYTFGQLGKVKSALDSVHTTSATIVHHRAATHGSVCYDNTHPFEHKTDSEHVVGVHNGTIHAFSRSQDDRKFDVDSDWLYYNIAKKGAAEALSDVNGAYALLWYEAVSKRFRMASNLERPLHFAYVKGEDSMLIASELEMLYWLATRNKLAIEAPLYVPKDKIISVDKDKSVRDTRVEDIPEKKYIRTTTYTPRTQASLQTGSEYGPQQIAEFGFVKNETAEFFYTSKARDATPHGISIYGEAINANGQVMDAVILHSNETTAYNISKALTCNVSVVGVQNFISPNNKQDHRLIVYPVAAEMEEEEEPLALIPMEDDGVEEDAVPLVMGPRGRQIPVTRYMELVKTGCGCCSKDLGLRDADDLGWVGNDSPLCKECVEDISQQVYAG